MAKVFLSGHVDVPADRLAAVRAALPEHIRLTRAEAGCLSFEVVESADVAGRLLVSEVFDSQEAFDAHQTRTRSFEWFRVTEGIAREYKVTRG